jgi:hypothetical protein
VRPIIENVQNSNNLANKDPDFLLAYTRNIPVDGYLMRFSPKYASTYTKIAVAANNISDPDLRAQKVAELWAAVDREAIMSEAAESFERFQDSEFIKWRDQMHELGRLAYSPTSHAASIAAWAPDGAVFAADGTVAEIPLEEYDSIETRFRASAASNIDDCAQKLRSDSGSSNDQEAITGSEDVCAAQLLEANLRAFTKGDVRQEQIGSVYVVNFLNGDVLDTLPANRLKEMSPLVHPASPYETSDWH